MKPKGADFTAHFNKQVLLGLGLAGAFGIRSTETHTTHGTTTKTRNNFSTPGR